MTLLSMALLVVLQLFTLHTSQILVIVAPQEYRER